MTSSVVTALGEMLPNVSRRFPVTRFATDFPTASLGKCCPIFRGSPDPFRARFSHRAGEMLPPVPGPFRGTSGNCPSPQVHRDFVTLQRKGGTKVDQRDRANKITTTIVVIFLASPTALTPPSPQSLLDLFVPLWSLLESVRVCADLLVMLVLARILWICACLRGVCWNLFVLARILWNLFVFARSLLESVRTRAGPVVMLVLVPEIGRASCRERVSDQV